MILDSILAAFIRLAQITSGLRQPIAAVGSYVLLDALTNQPAFWVRDGVIYNGAGVAVATVGADGSLQAKRKPVVMAVDGAITIQDATVYFTKAGVLAATLAAPTAGTHDGVQMNFISTTAQAHTITHTEGFAGGTTSRDVATFGGAIQDGMQIEAYNGVWYIKATRNVTIG
ncbi:MAG TPA: hypothetical protein VGP24_11800 [Glaciihabitans sp.]|jgi:hypothetical protein|nr:hypothetical protein [Glaciihabitans sp.]